MTTNEPLDDLTLAQISGSGYRDGERGAEKRDLTARYGEAGQREYLEGYALGFEKSQRFEL